MAILSIPIAKAGKNAFIEVDETLLSDAIITKAIEEGLKVLLNAGMSKVGAVTKLIGEELTKAHAKALEIANSNLEALKAGTVKKGRATSAKAKGIPNTVVVEARRLAREVIKDEIKRRGER